MRTKGKSLRKDVEESSSEKKSGLDKKNKLDMLCHLEPFFWMVSSKVF